MGRIADDADRRSCRTITSFGSLRTSTRRATDDPPARPLLRRHQAPFLRFEVMLGVYTDSVNVTPLGL